jgi:peptidoglycan hydrolase CwlO-like protein
MKRCLLIFLLLFGTFFGTKTFAQTVYSDSTQLKIGDLEDRVSDLEAANDDLTATIEAQKKHIAQIDSQLMVTQANVQHIADSLNITVSKVSDVDKLTQSQITGLNKSLSAKSRYWLMGILSLALLSLIVFLFLRRKMTSNAAKLDSQITQTKETLDSQITQTNEAIQTESQKVDSKLVEIQKSNVSLHYESILLKSKLGEIAQTNEVMQAEGIKLDSEIVAVLTVQMEALKKERGEKGKDKDKDKVDHKLPKKVGDEVYRIKKRIEILPKKIKGITALKNSLQKLEDEFTALGYTIEEMLGKKYDPKAKVEVKFVENPDILVGDEIITDIIHPQIAYKGKVIQNAKIEVSKHPSAFAKAEKVEKVEKAAPEKTAKEDKAPKEEKAGKTAKANETEKTPEPEKVAKAPEPESAEQAPEAKKEDKAPEAGEKPE